MTIHEIEERTGMARANIRYYERAGLLSPERGGNNYRDYSEADLADLQKIRLLRRLRIPITEIVRLQSGEAALGDILAEQAGKLREESAELTDAAALCRVLLDAQVSYTALDAEYWLECAGIPAETPRRWQHLALDVLPTEPYLWKRLLARLLDFTLVSTALAVYRIANRWPFLYEIWIVKLIEGWVGIPDWVYAWENALAAFGVFALLEPLLLCTIGTTPGKWLFGLRVERLDGGRLTYWQGLKRMAGIFIRGLGCTLPVYSLWRLWRSYRTAAKGGVLPWEGGSCCEAEPRRLCGLWFVLANAACLAAVFFTFTQAILPQHTGDLTVSELVDNCNQFQWQYCCYRGCYMTEEGRWIDVKDPENRRATGSVVGDDPVYQFETDGRGIVTAVRIDYTYCMTGRTDTPSAPGDTDLLYFAYVMANNHVTPWELIPQFRHHYRFGHMPGETEDFTVTDGCIRITNRFEVSGYEERDDGCCIYTFPIEGEEQYIHWVMSMEMVGQEQP